MNKPSKRCYELIQEFEGYHKALLSGACKAYPDPGSANGLPVTIGWGTTVYRNAGLARYGRTKVHLSDVLTRAEADKEFEAAVEIFAALVNKANPNLTQNQFDAAVSFTYNLGPNTKQMERLKKGQLNEFAASLALYNQGRDGRPMPGLIRRRAAELALWKEDSVSTKVTWLALTRRTGKYILTAMAGDTAIKEHEWKTKAELQRLLALYPNAGTAVPTTSEWVPEKEATESEPVKPTTAILKRTTNRLPNGLFQLVMSVGDKNFLCVSGQGYAQQFRKPSDPRSVPGNMEPIPQGKYTIGKVEWKGAPGDWSKTWGPGLGACWIALSATFSDDRGAFGIHKDEGAPGSAGCVVFSQAELTKLLPFLEGVKYLDVQWGV